MCVFLSNLECFVDPQILKGFPSLAKVIEVADGSTMSV